MTDVGARHDVPDREDATAFLAEFEAHWTDATGAAFVALSTTSAPAVQHDERRQVARERIWRLMKTAGLQGRHSRAWKKATVAGLRPVDAPDLIGQDFTAEPPDTRRCGDITYVQPRP